MSSRFGSAVTGWFFLSAVLGLSLIGLPIPGAAQDIHCSSRVVNSELTTKPLTDAEVAHTVLVNTPVVDWKKFSWGDVEFVLRCGSEEDGAGLFAAVRDTSVRMNGATVVQADQNFIRVSWDDGFNLGAFKFNFDQPLTEMPQPGEKIIISGTYSSYNREPLIINFVHPVWLPLPPKL